MLIAVSMSIIAITSCEKEDNSSQSNIQDQVNSDMQSGTWRITYFFDSEKDETHHFTGFNFIFQSNGALIASKGSTLYEGSWSITKGNSSDDNPNEMDFNILFNISNDFEDLNDDWNILTRSETKIELIDISGGNGGTDYLTFEKN